MKIYAVSIDIDADDPREYFMTMREALECRLECEPGFGEIERIETSLKGTELLLAILNESEWVTNRTTVKPSK